MDLKDLGITKECIIEKVAQLCADELIHDDDAIYSSVARRLEKQLKDQIDAAVTKIGDELVAPKIAVVIEDTVLTKTNQWGEKIGEPLTFKEYLVSRAETYMTEDVDHNGKSRAESRDSYWKKHSTRVAFMIDKHIQYNIETAMKKALADANSTIAQGLAGAVRIALANATESLKVAVTTK